MWVLNPKFTVTERMHELAKLSDPLEDELETLRAKGFESWAYYKDNTKPTPILDRIRELRRQIAKLDKEYWEISMEVNKEYHAMNPLNRRGPPRMYSL